MRSRLRPRGRRRSRGRRRRRLAPRTSVPRGASAGVCRAFAGPGRPGAGPRAALAGAARSRGVSSAAGAHRGVRSSRCTRRARAWARVRRSRTWPRRWAQAGHCAQRGSVSKSPRRDPPGSRARGARGRPRRGPRRAGRSSAVVRGTPRPSASGPTPHPGKAGRSSDAAPRASSWAAARGSAGRPVAARQPATGASPQHAAACNPPGVARGERHPVRTPGSPCAGPSPGLPRGSFGRSRSAFAASAASSSASSALRSPAPRGPRGLHRAPTQAARAEASRS
jgi:hypothetical protein